MKLTNEQKNQIMETFLRNINIVSDKEYQKRIWIEGQGPECHSFEELVTYYFDESDAILLSYKEFGITEKQRELLIKFHRPLKDFSDQNDFPQYFINSPEWDTIVEMAKNVLNAFNYQKEGR